MKENIQIKTAIIGISGYSGLALAQILDKHPNFQIKASFSSNYAGKNLSELHSLFLGNLNPETNTQIESLDNLIDNLKQKQIECVFTATPNGVSSSLCEVLSQNNIKLIDLSADFRFKNTDIFEEWYKPLKAPNINLLNQSVYGLTEWNRENIKNTSILANPGCYPTASLLALLPLIKNNIIINNSIIIDAKSGATGAGRKAEQNLLFCEVSENFSAYKPLLHRHIPEIEQYLSQFGNNNINNIKIRFTPHLLPIKRGILNTIYCKPQDNIKRENLNQNIQEIFQETYKNDFFVHYVFESPSTKAVYGTNKCHVFSCYDKRTDLIILVSVIDNLIKGASGQAIQNANIMFNLPENTGLINLGLLP